MKKKLFFALSITSILAFSLFWFSCQKEIGFADKVHPAQSLVSNTERGGGPDCIIQNPGPAPSCGAQIRVRCVHVAPGYSVYHWEVAGRWFRLENNGQVKDFQFYLHGGVGGGEQQGVWYDFPDRVIKQYIWDLYCPNNIGNQIDCLVLTDAPDYVTQWGMWVDIKSGNTITTYYMNGATGILTPVQLVHLPDPSVAFDQTDVDFLTDCTNMGAQGIQCNPMVGCAECATSGGGEE